MSTMDPLERVSELEAENARLRARVGELEAEVASLREATGVGASISTAAGSVVSVIGEGFNLLTNTFSQAKAMVGKTRLSTGVYTGVEVEQMRLMHQYWQGAPLPELWAMNDDFTGVAPSNAASIEQEAGPASYALRVWRPHVRGDPPPPLAREALQILGITCTYQTERAGRRLGIAGCGYVDDPRNLLLYVLKRWAVDELAHADPVFEQTRIMVARWRNFLSLLHDSETFSPGVNSETTMQQVLRRLTEVLGDLERRCGPDTADTPPVTPVSASTATPAATPALPTHQSLSSLSTGGDQRSAPIATTASLSHNPDPRRRADAQPTPTPSAPNHYSYEYYDDDYA